MRFGNTSNTICLFGSIRQNRFYTVQKHEHCLHGETVSYDIDLSSREFVAVSLRLSKSSKESFA